MSIDLEREELIKTQFTELVSELIIEMIESRDLKKFFHFSKKNW